MNEQLYACAWKSQFLSGPMQPLMGFIGNLGYVAVCVVGAILTMNGSISFSVIVAFIFIFGCLPNPFPSLHRRRQACSLRRRPVSGYLSFCVKRSFRTRAAKRLRLRPQTAMWNFPMCVSSMTQRNYYSRLLRFRESRSEDCHCRPHRSRKNHDGQPAHALL